MFEKSDIFDMIESLRRDTNTSADAHADSRRGSARSSMRNGFFKKPLDLLIRLQAWATPIGSLDGEIRD